MKKNEPKSITAFNAFIEWLDKIKSNHRADLLKDNERYVNLLDKFTFLDKN